MLLFRVLLKQLTWLNWVWVQGEGEERETEKENCLLESNEQYLSRLKWSVSIRQFGKLDNINATESSVKFAQFDGNTIAMQHKSFIDKRNHWILSPYLRWFVNNELFGEFGCGAFHRYLIISATMPHHTNTKPLHTYFVITEGHGARVVNMKWGRLVASYQWFHT